MNTDFLKRFTKAKKKKTASKIETPRKKPLITSPVLKPDTYRLFFCLGLSVVIALLIAPRLTVPTYSYRPGDISQHTVRAPRDYSVEDKESTEKNRAQRAESVRSVYDFNSRAEDEIEQRVINAFSVMRSSLQKRASFGTGRREAQELFEKTLKIQLQDRDFDVLVNRTFKKEIDDYLLDLILPFAQREVVISKEQLFKERERGIVLRNIHTNEEIILDDFSSVIDLREARALIRREARSLLANVRVDVRRTIITLATGMVEPTVTFNKIETNARRVAAVQELSPLYYNVKKGEIIIREGAKITDATLVKLKALTSLSGRKSIIWTLGGYFLLCFLTLVVLFRFSSAKIINSFLIKFTDRDLVFLCITFVFTFVVIKFWAGGARLFSKGYTTIPLDAYFYAIPFCFAAIVISVVLSPQIAAMSAIIISLFCCFMLDSRVVFFIFSFISSLVAAQEVGQSKERKAIIRAGIIIGGVNVLLILSLSMIAGDISKAETAICIGFGVLGGILSAVLATGIIPIVEIVFNYTTDIKLLELADLNQPVLRQLLITAPGTYHHSILVGILAEAAAEAISANPLLARVSAYYHDIGKMRKPLYFVENQQGGENRHDKLLPSMSSLIITKHTKDGVEIAREHRLGKAIQDIIDQHHGTSVVTYFYQKAKEKSEKNGQPVNDKDFRYPGPRPQTKEAGIVMLADAVEATSKTLSEPTPARIQGMVQRIINNIFVDGQLDECELTLKDLHLIAGSFIRILNGIFHSRIDYPVQAEKEANGRDSDKKQPKTDPDKHHQDKKDGDRDLGKRIGLAKS